MKMKKGLKITKALFILFILVSTVSLMPVVNAEVTMPDSDLSKLRIIKNKIIEKLGEERYQEIENDVSDKIDIQFMTISPTDYDLPFYEFLKEFATIIVAIMIIMFGHNFVGESLGAGLCILLLGIPVFLLAIIVAIMDFNEATSMLGIDIKSLIEQFGIVGTLLISIFLIPCLIIVLGVVIIFVTPIIWVDLITALIQYAISNA